MNRHSSGGYSPIRAKRRQSDAKWRASVATCYDALKYVVPNVKHLSKRKISKALILQECEKHISELEDSIKHVLNVECESKGVTLMWRDGASWSPCTLEKLQADFSERQRSVFHTTAHGRRCYNLLQDIKEEVFSMKADPRHMALLQKSLNLDVLENNANEVRAVPIPYAGHAQVIQLKEESVHASGQTQAVQSVAWYGDRRVDATPNNEKQRTVSRYADVFFNNKDKTQMRQQPRPRLRLASGEDSDVDRALLRGCTKSGYSGSSYKPSYFLTPAPKMKDESQIVPCLGSSTTGSASATIQGHASSSSLGMDCKSNSEYAPGVVKKEQNREEDHDQISIKVKVEKKDSSSYSVSGGREYSCLLKALEADTEQEVPSLDTPLKSSMAKRQRLTSSCSDYEGFPTLQDLCADHLKKETVKGSSSGAEDIGPSSNSCHDNIFPSESLNNISASEGAPWIAVTGVQAVGSDSNTLPALAHIKVEIDDTSSFSYYNHDPLLSAISTSKNDQSTPWSGYSVNNVTPKNLPKYGSARKKLNFTSHTQTGGFHNTSCFWSPSRNALASPQTFGFTPVKLPDDFNFNSGTNIPFDAFVSPWKMLNSPCDSRTVPQGYFDRGAGADLDDSLLCLETMDTMEFDDSLDKDISPPKSSSGKKFHMSDGRKTSVSSEQSNRPQPKCRKRLERFYDQPSSSKGANSTASVLDCHVVPQLEDVKVDRDEVSSEPRENSVPATLSSPADKISSPFKDSSDFDGFFFYYRQVSQKLKDKLGCQDMQSPSVAAKVAHMWSRLPQQDKMTMSTLATFENHHGKVDSSFLCGQLSDDLKNVEVELMNPQDVSAFI